MNFLNIGVQVIVIGGLLLVTALGSTLALFLINWIF